MTAFLLGPGGLFLCAAGPGELSTASALCGVAHSAGARVLVVTAEPDGATSALVDELLVIPAQTMARDTGSDAVLPMGSLFEGAMFLVFEVLVLRLRKVFGETTESMRDRLGSVRAGIPWFRAWHDRTRHFLVTPRSGSLARVATCPTPRTCP
ncbi:MAG: hypothetical protein U9O18_00275 [Chloroflexota bacterium]|nr:hypothetical protein [Chloroflexota bacterium]